MKRFPKCILSAVLVTLSLSAVMSQADDDDSQDSITGLKFVMKDMGAQFKILQDGLIKHDPVSTADLQAAADKLLADMKNAKGRLPDQLVDSTGKPLAAKQAEIQQYNNVMDQLISAGTKFDTAIQSGDTQTATTLLSGDLSAIRKQGHDVFNPQP